MQANLFLVILTGALVGASSGFLGSFMVLKRMSLVGDALSHVALPGMAVALTFGINPMLGALVALTFAIFGVWYLGERTEIYSETLVGVFFTGSLAIGILITPETELLEALFGNIEKIGIWDGMITMFASVIIYLVTRKISDRLLLGVVSEDLAKSTGVEMSKVNLIYLLMVGLAVALGVKFIGTLLTGAMVIVPAAAAKNFAGSVSEFQILAVLIGVVSAVFGIFIAGVWGIASGPAVVLVSVFIFILSYFFKKN
jgi:ABC-type Mn2+/Zn2+ transport system permease subunit